MALQRGVGIVLRTRPFSESDLIVDLFLDTRGRRSLIAKGARGRRSTLGGVFDGLNRVEVVYYEKPGLDLVSQASLLHSYAALKGDLNAVTEALRVARMLDRLLPPHHPEESAYVVFEALLRALDERPDVADGPCLAAQLKLLALLGHRPQLLACARCGREEGPYSFSPPEGGVVCGHCGGEAGAITSGLARALHRLMRLPLDRARVVRLRAEELALARSALDAYVDRLAAGG
ncbi:MAG: DNA repair protein RecO [Candidatus Bipolaricaulota bacterium]|nr:MAG: DNA repair protein RecO [Candidatus Bipolaricaulota bacterium]